MMKGRSAVRQTADENWQPLRRMRTHEQVLEAVESQILRGHLRSGDRLPSERELSVMLAVSRPSVREALRVLEWMGVIVAGVGSGRDAGSIITGRPSEALSRVLRIHLALANFSLDDLVATRIALEASAVISAAANAKVADLQVLEEIVAEMHEDADEMDIHRWSELDTDFHVSVAVASGNQLLVEVIQALRDAVQQEMLRGFARYEDWRVVARELQHEHAEILDAIKSADPERAQEVMRSHISGFYGDLGPHEHHGEWVMPEGGTGNGTAPQPVATPKSAARSTGRSRRGSAAQASPAIPMDDFRNR